MSKTGSFKFSLEFFNAIPVIGFFNNLFHRLTGDGMQGAVQESGKRALEITRDLTHVHTGSLRDAHRLSVTKTGWGSEARVFIDPGAVARTKYAQRVAVYGAAEHERGYPHNFYQRAIDEHGDEIGRAGTAALERAIGGI